MKKDRITNILMVILVLLVAAMIVIQIGQNLYVEVRLKNALQSIEVKDGYTPIKDIDYKDGIDGLNGRDGVNGKDGKDSLSTHTIETIIKEVPVNGEDGKTSETRCNESRNRWEVKYSDSDSWQIQYGEVGQVVKCTIEELK